VYSSAHLTLRRQLTVADTPEKRGRPFNRDAFEAGRLRIEYER